MTIDREPACEHTDARGALTMELARLDALLSEHLRELRARGRTILGDAVGGAVIEEGEAEGLLRSLHASHLGLGGASPSGEARRSPLEPLERTRQLYGLSPVERDLLLLGLCVEIDSRYARLVAFLNDHVSMTRPTLGLAATVLAGEAGPAREDLIRRLLSDGPLLRFALLRLEGDEPLTNRTLVVPDDVWPRLIGIPAAGPFTVRRPSIGIDALELPEPTAEMARKVRDRARLQAAGEVHVLVSGPKESGREALGLAIATALRPTVLVVSAPELESPDSVRRLDREARWNEAAVLLLEAEKVPAGTRSRLLKELGVPLVSTGESGKSAGLMDEVERQPVEVVIPRRELPDATRLWAKLLAASAIDGSVDSGALAARFRFGPGRIVSAIRLACGQAESGGRNAVGQLELEAACHRLRETNFGDLAQKLPRPYGEQDIVLPASTRRELDLIAAWARHGAATFGAGGLGQRLNAGRGLACLFSGPPGTGKTMAAQVIARKIDFDVYRIDLSQVVDKYIGETEKNLSRVFDEAERSRVVLFFDEADALFGRRSEVKDAHDRFANIEIGYLLQRLEVHEGLVILATNLQKNMDDAFLRRLQVKAEFPVPDAADRQAIWERLLPPPGQRARDIDTELLSARFEIAGGDIRNAIFTALLWAAEERAELSMRHVVLGLWRELQRSGRMVDLAHFGPWRAEIEARSDEMKRPRSSPPRGTRAPVERR